MIFKIIHVLSNKQIHIKAVYTMHSISQRRDSHLECILYYLVKIYHGFEQFYYKFKSFYT